MVVAVRVADQTINAVACPASPADLCISYPAPRTARAVAGAVLRIAHVKIYSVAHSKPCVTAHTSQVIRQQTLPIDTRLDHGRRVASLTPIACVECACKEGAA